MTATKELAYRRESRVLTRLSRWRNRHRHWVGWLFILPWVIGFLWFDVLPFFLNLYLSFTDFSVGAKLPNWIGLANYREIFGGGDHLIGISFKNTVYYMGFSVPLLIIFAFSLALLLNTNIRGRGVYRTIYYLPSLVPIVASSIIWLFMLRTRGGLINLALGLFGIDPIPWLSRPEWAKPALILMSLWGFGGQMVIYLAGLQGISQELYEAAEIDGASSWQKLIRITIPLMTPTIFFNLIMGIIGSFQVFTAAFIMTGGGPLNSTLFYMLHLYNNAFNYFKMGYASAMAVVLFFIILTLTLIVNWTSERWVYYDTG
ncbi:MAG TPA: sugar ABC transporter permease [Caldilineae bacterium]|nr:sugar ABC transporter permease [Caldilineae bacterium]